ncbi:hypothetical protein EGT07_01325 [Herbaspirillum sp. HC18]|nr:hypothetical protein EGT07_01325 [Herbaspirillum sp. HC18]
MSCLNVAVMLKQAIAVLLLAPALASSAECGFVSSSSEMTIVVGKKSNGKCFNSEPFREAFRSNLTASLKSMEPKADARTQKRRPQVNRNLPAAELPVQEAELYYGQNLKR